MEKLENKLKIKKKLGVLGGSFDPAHKGHLAISKEAIKKFKLKKVIWAITKKNPLKRSSKNSINKRIKSCKKIIGKNHFINVKFYEDLIRSNKTINLINYLKKITKSEIYFLMGADNLLNFHKWYQWKKISQKCKIIVFDRHGYKKKSLNSTAFKRLGKKNLEFINFKKINISSSQLRKI